MNEHDLFLVYKTGSADVWSAIDNRVVAGAICTAPGVPDFIEKERAVLAGVFGASQSGTILTYRVLPEDEESMLRGNLGGVCGDDDAYAKLPAGEKVLCMYAMNDVLIEMNGDLPEVPVPFFLQELNASAVMPRFQPTRYRASVQLQVAGLQDLPDVYITYNENYERCLALAKDKYDFMMLTPLGKAEIPLGLHLPGTIEGGGWRISVVYKFTKWLPLGQAETVIYSSDRIPEDPENIRLMRRRFDSKGALHEVIIGQVLSIAEEKWAS